MDQPRPTAKAGTPPARHPRLDDLGRDLLVLGGYASAFFMAGLGIFLAAFWGLFISMEARGDPPTAGWSGGLFLVALSAAIALPVILALIVRRALDARGWALGLLAVIGVVLPVAIWLSLRLDMSGFLSFGHLVVPPLAMAAGSILRLIARPSGQRPGT